ncbi:MAG: peptide-methionine (R)-S-oxide reductase MsrB [Spirochaetaceae bacterium]|nr:peptide-methionine (R)-S-oxide reductase MsrB [Spirochaetaceae bacterium]
MSEIFLAGGCFWGVEEYFSRLDGVSDVKSGYANGTSENPTYELVCSGKYGFAEAIKITYDKVIITLDKILSYYFKIVDPTSLNKQGNDKGVQYRCGIYYVDNLNLRIINNVVNLEKARYEKPFVLEIKELENFYEAEEYHQDYLVKNPHGYCHISFDSLKSGANLIDLKKYRKEEDASLKNRLSKNEYDVTQNAATEAPYSSEYYNSDKKGLYVDIVTGEPLFLSTEKFNSGCGWPSFSKPIFDEVVKFNKDKTYSMDRIEVKSRIGESHLGHVFNDGPLETGGLRYCINGASLKFIPFDKLKDEGYEEFINLF